LGKLKSFENPKIRSIEDPFADDTPEEKAAIIKVSLINEQKKLARKNKIKRVAAANEAAFLAETFGKNKKF
jgi:hypothetical protein